MSTEEGRRKQKQLFKERIPTERKAWKFPSVGGNRDVSSYLDFGMGKVL